ncbi:MAG: TRAP transporter substrate-binding protein [Hyphomicrobiales bacterium]|nr:TRAP transporter substrate-binding protein [Hyphomicrobiales bacterium]
MYKFVSLAAGALALTLGSGIAAAQDQKINLRLSYWVPPKHKLTPGFKAWGDYLKKESKGTLSVTLFPSSQLGSGRDHYDMVKRGVADIGYVNPGYTPGRFPVIGILELPFQISDSLKGAKAMTRFYAKYAAKEMPDVKVCHTFSTPISSFHATKPIRVPADIKGMRIRAGNATISSFVSSLGGSPVQVPIMEAFETLKRGITEGISSAYGGMIIFNFGKVVHNHLDMPLYVSAFVNAVNLKAYNRMSAAQKKIFDSTCTPEWAEKIFRPWNDQDTMLTKRVKADKKQKIYQPTKEDVAKWRKAAEPVYAQWAESVKAKGYDPKTVMTELHTLLKEEGALYE